MMQPSISRQQTVEYIPTDADRPSLTVHEYLRQLTLAKWNAIIPKSALRTEEDGSSIKYLHPTKGWRWVHKRRLQVFG